MRKYSNINKYLLCILLLSVLTMQGCIGRPAQAQNPKAPDIEEPEDIWGNPAGFFANETIEVAELKDGVMWYSISGYHPKESASSEPVKVNVVCADLTNPHVTFTVLLGDRYISRENGHFWSRSRVTQLLEDNSAIAAINGGFFYMTSGTGAVTQAPLRITISDGMVLRSSEIPGMYLGSISLARTDSGQAIIGPAQVAAGFRTPTDVIPIDSINQSDFSQLNSKLIMYTAPWDRSPGNDSAFIKNVDRYTEVCIEVVGIEKAKTAQDVSIITGKIIDKQQNGESIPLDNNTLVMRGVNETADKLSQLSINDEVEILWQVKMNAPRVGGHQIQQLIAGTEWLVQNGSVFYLDDNHGHMKYPRSAVGINKDGTKIALVVVDGNQPEHSVGMSINDLAKFLKHMDIYNGLNLDGGGSASASAMIDGKPALLNKPSGGSERYVADGIGIIIK